MENKFVSIVAYLNDDPRIVGDFLDKVVAAVSATFSQYEVILVDDGCTEYTIRSCREILEQKQLAGMVSLLHMGFHQGIEAAMNAGRDAAIGDFVYEFDRMTVDYDVSVVTKVYERMVEGYDIVGATNGIDRNIASKMFYAVFNRYSNSRIHIGSETFRLISRRAINRIRSMGNYIPYRKAVYANCGLKVDEIEYKSTSKKSDSKGGLHNARKERSTLALDSFIYFTNVMEKISAIISGVFLVFSLVMIVYTIADYLIERTLAEGWTSLMCFMSVGFFGVFALLTIILKYMSVLLDLVFKKQKYLVADIEKIK